VIAHIRHGFQAFGSDERIVRELPRVDSFHTEGFAPQGLPSSVVREGLSGRVRLAIFWSNLLAFIKPTDSHIVGWALRYALADRGYESPQAKDERNGHGGTQFC